MILHGSKLNEVFKQLMKKHESYYWLAAWAGKPFELTRLLLDNKTKIRKMIIGIHFYQTHPEFIKKFISLKEVKYIKQPDGTFHSKLYLFESDNGNWDLLIGSANFTDAAFNSNHETMVWLNGLNSELQDLKRIKNIIDVSWNDSKSFTPTELKRYAKSWDKRRPNIEGLKTTFTKTGIKKDPREAAVVDMSWEEFVKGVKAEKGHGYKSRIRLLDEVQEYFTKKKSLKNMSLDQRKAVGGFLGVKEGIDWGWFGSMMGSGVFKNKMSEHYNGISDALDEIPFSGTVSKDNFNRFAEKYAGVVGSNSWIATATRLLAMKRPDIFVCLDSKNQSKLCKNFAITASNMTYDRYWDDIIERIYLSKWWKKAKTGSGNENEIYKYRAAFLDALYYEY